MLVWNVKLIFTKLLIEIFLHRLLTLNCALYFSDHDQ